MPSPADGGKGVHRWSDSEARREAEGLEQGERKQGERRVGVSLFEAGWELKCFRPGKEGLRASRIKGYMVFGSYQPHTCEVRNFP